MTLETLRAETPPDFPNAAPPSRAPATIASDAAERDPWLDNARFVLISLVVFGHLLEPLLASHPLLGDSYRFVYSFHMPAFAFLSGAVAQARLDARLLRNVLFRLLLPYLAFQGLYALAAQWSQWPDGGPSGVVTPYWLLWYLLSLACWRLLLPLFARLRYSLPIAVGLALAAGCSNDIGYYLSLSRTLVFFPLFLLGWQLARRWRRRSGRPGVRILAAAVLGVLFVFAATSGLDPRWLYGSYGYAELGTPPVEGAALRLLLIGCATVGTCAFLALVPRRRLALTALGRRSLGAYVLQGFLVNLAIGAGLFASLAPLPRTVLLPLLLALAAALAAALSARPVQRLLAPIASPRWLERRLWRDAVHE